MRPRGVAQGLAILVAVLAVVAVHAADAPDHESRLKAVEDALRNAQERAAELARQADDTTAKIADLQAQMVEIAKRAQDSESSLSQLEAELARLEKSEAATRADIAREEGRLVDTLAALQRLSMQPREAMILRPEAPIDTVRSALLLRFAVPTLMERAGTLRQGLERLRDLRAEIARRRAGQETSAAALRAENERLAALVAQMKTLQQSTEAERTELTKRVAGLAAQAKDLRELVAGIDWERARDRQQEAMLTPSTERPAPPSEAVRSMPGLGPEESPTARRIRPFPKDGKGVVLPARGRVVERFGDVGPAGFKNRGIALETRPAADVVAPFDGQVVFRGPFRGYGEILLIAHRGGYYTVLAGLARTDVAVGQWLVAGEPVGIMGPSDTGNPKLYVELRLGQNQIDPAPWLGLRDK
ncbi:MAG: peptidoglycan DD-metalloendopeptidase family protein [Rhodospirillaceae bacterium]|nr:peptidoglycan DD-metalloendopeptidase family protein [Rhodospirillaceae bacterium]